MAFNKIQLKTLAVEEATPGKNSPEDLIFYVEGSTGDVKKTQIKDLQISEQGDVYTVNGKTGSVVLDADDVGAVSKTGDTMTGKLALPGGIPLGALSVGDEGYVGTGHRGRMAFYASEDKDRTKDGWIFRTLLNGMGKRDALTINTDGELFVRGTNPVYHTGNKPSAADVGALPTSWRPAWNEVTGKPTVFTPATHTHPTSQITGLDSALQSVGGLSGGPSNKDPNTDLSFHFLTNHANSPIPGIFWHITQTFWAGVSANANRAQTAVQYNGGSSMYVRSLYSGTWTPWRKVFSTGDKPTWNDIEGKPSTFTPSSHRHTWGEINGKPAESTRWPTWGEVTGKPSTFPAQTHTHSWDELRGVAPVSKLPLGTTSTTVAAGNHNHDSSYSKLGHKHNWADINGVPVYATRWPNYGEVGLKVTDIPSISQYLGTADLNTIETPGFYYQTSNANTSAARNYPTTLAGSLLVQKSAGITQMYTTYSPGANKVYVRSKYSNSWGSWIELYSTFNKPTLAELGAQPAGSYAAASHTHAYAPLNGTGASGTWGISISGNAATAKNIANSGTVTLGSATESNSISITQPSFSQGKPVKLLNFDWYGDKWSLGNIRSGSTPSDGLGVYFKDVEKFRFTNGSFQIGSNTALHSGNYNSYAPTKTGGGASGTWGISVSGNAGTATKLSSISNTFSGKYPILVNANGVVYGHNSMQFEGATGTLSAPTFAGSLSGNATTASKWATGRTLTIGNKGKSVDGSANVTWSLAEIGAQPAGSYAASSHTHPWSQVTGAPATATRWPTFAEVTGKPSTFAPSAHNHSWSNITSGVPATATRWPTFAEVSGKPTNYPTTWESVAAKPATATRWPSWSEVSSKPTKFTPASHSHKVFEEHTTLFDKEIGYSGSTIYTLAQPWSNFDAIMTLASGDSRDGYSSSILTKKQLEEMYAKAVPAASRSWLLHASTETFFYWRMTDTTKQKFQIVRENGILYKIIGIKYISI